MRRRAAVALRQLGFTVRQVAKVIGCVPSSMVHCEHLFDLVDNFHGTEIASFVREVRRAVGRNLHIVWDRLNGHRTAERLLADLGDSVVFEHLPGYAPELDPVEQVWAHSKHGDLANDACDDAVELVDHVFESLIAKQGQRQLLAAFFTPSGSPL